MGTEFSRRGLLVRGGALTAGGLLSGTPMTSEAWAAAVRSAVASAPSTPDEDGHELWLRYRLVDSPDRLRAYRRALTHVVVAGDGQVLRSAGAELLRGLPALTGRPVPEEPEPRSDGAVIIGTPESAPAIRALAGSGETRRLGPEGYRIQRQRVQGFDAIVVSGHTERGALYGAFDLLRRLQTHQDIAGLDVRDRPANPLRLANHWDNLDRTVERGYAGPSIFHWDDLPEIKPHYVTYARALASVGVNGTVVNNVNADPAFLDTPMLDKLTGLAEVLRAWGVRLYLSANFACPILLGGLPTADPLDAGVRAWWQDKARELYEKIPDLGGLLVKANSEGQPGPETYGRTHADGANLLARAVEPYGGIVMWRAFIHDFDSETWAHKSYETFTPLDGKFAGNAILQIKNGPIDFQVREPVHPLFGALPHTNSMLELQVTQEYTGQSTHLCYLVPMWKQVYDFDTHAEGRGTSVADILAGSAYGYAHSGVAGVMNFGSDRNWTRHHLAAANTHGFARLAWNPGLEPEQVAEEWAGMTFGPHPHVTRVLSRMLLSSWEIYESYTSPLGSGFMIEGDHFSPSPETNQSWHQADGEGAGFDRTIATGSGYTAYYHPPVTRVFESLDTCPDELLLFMHHVPYGHRLHSGKTMIQHIYDSHFEGRNDAVRLRELWRSLGSAVDDRRHRETLERFDRQVRQATLWRDSIAGYFFERGKVLDERRSWVQVRTEAPDVLLGGWPNLFDLVVGNASPGEVEVTAGFAAKEGWSSGTSTKALAPREFAVQSVPVTPPLTPVVTTLRADVDAGGHPVLGKTIEVFTAPAGARCRLALDAGSASSPLLPGYRRLSPGDRWDPEQGYGWVDSEPQSRDRGGLDPLRRDFVNDTVPHTLRVRVPAGVHDAYLLVGDTGAESHPTYVHAGGELLAESPLLLNGIFSWIHFRLDGGAAGRTTDLELSSVAGQHWHLNALVIPDPDAEIPRVVVNTVSATMPLFGGRENAVTASLLNTTGVGLQVTADLVVPQGWSTEAGTVTAPAGEAATVEVTVVPAGTPALATLEFGVSIDGEPVGDRRTLEAIAVPPGDAAVLALDAGSDGSPLLPGYRRLSPADAWTTSAGYGWVGAPPQSRDRQVLDPLRRDFVNDTTARTLRVAVPAGAHDAFLLVGDGNQPSHPTYVKANGDLLAESAPLRNGEFEWIRFGLDGGSAGREVDLELSSVPEEHWHLVALVVLQGAAAAG